MSYKTFSKKNAHRKEIGCTFALRLEKRILNESLNRRQVKSLNYKTQSAKKEEVERAWHHFDATDAVVGRLATEIARLLRGKHKPSYTPHVDTGDYVIVTNVENIRFTGNKMKQKEYLRYSGYPGGQKSKRAEEIMATHPERILESAVRGMLPKNTLGRQMFKKLFIYTGEEHPHQAQKPTSYNL